MDTSQSPTPAEINPVEFDHEVPLAYNAAPEDLDIIEHPDIAIESKESIYEKHVGHDQILGHMAVSQNLQNAEEITGAPDGGTVSEKAERNLIHNASLARADLRVKMRSQVNKDILEKYLDQDDTNVPAMFRKWKDSEGKVSWEEWLSNGATQEQFINFLEWHNYHMNEVQRSPDVQEQIATQKLEYAEGITKAIEEGWLPPDASKALDILQKTEVRVGDIFDMAMTGRLGYHYEKFDYAVVDKNLIRDVTKHELNHTVLGGVGDAFLNEAITEHITQSLARGDFMKFDPHGSKQGPYAYEREILEATVEFISRINPYGDGPEETMKKLLNCYVGRKNKDFVDYGYELGATIGVDNSIFNIIKDQLRNRFDDLHLNGMSDNDAAVAAFRSVQIDLLNNPDAIFNSSKTLATAGK